MLNFVKENLCTSDIIFFNSGALPNILHYITRLHEGQTVKKMLCCLVACAVRTRQRLLLSDTVKIADQKWAATHPRLGDGDALASVLVLAVLRLFLY